MLNKKIGTIGIIVLLILSVITPISMAITYKNEQTIDSVNEITPTFAGGDGSAGNPWQISNWTHLDDVRDDLTANYVLINNLTTTTDGYDDYNNDTTTGWLPIGNIMDEFEGIFDGDNHTVESLYINSPDVNNVGLFGYVYGGEIQNVGVIDVNITGNNLLGADSAGGLVGNNRNSIISNSYTTGNVTGIDYVGGLVGNNRNSIISNSYATSSTNSTSTSTGGLIGYIYDGAGESSIVTNSYSIGEILDAGGGLIGNISSADYEVNNCFWDTETSGTSISADGTGLNTVAMQSYDTFNDVGWDISINFVNVSVGNSYPYHGNSWTIDQVGYNLTIQTSGEGSTIPAEGTHIYLEGQVVDIEAQPDTGYHFVNWTGDATTITDVNSNDTTIEMLDNYTITANFGINVLETNPQYGEVQVDISSNVSVVFSSEMNTTIEPNLTQTNGTVVPYTFSHWSTTYITNDTANWTHDDWDIADNITLVVSNYTDIYNGTGEDYEWWFWTVDTTAPEIIDNELMSSGTTGEPYTFNATVTDNSGFVKDVYVNWYISGTKYNQTLPNVGGNHYERIINVPHEIPNLYYNVSAIDHSGNWNTSSTNVIPITDNDYPTITDNTPVSANIGDPYTFNATVSDNVGLKASNPRVIYWTDVSSLTNTTLSHVTGNYYERQISIPNDASTLYYFINATDTSDLKTSTGLTTIVLSDESAPDITDNTVGVPETGSTFTLNATIIDPNIDQTRAVYWTDTTDVINGSMSNTVNNYYEISISIPINATNLYYYFTASDTLGNWAKSGATTMAIADVSNPTVLSVTPIAGGTKQDEDVNVIITFDDQMDTTVIPTLTQTVGTTVSYTFLDWATTNVLDDTAMWSHDTWTAEDSISLKVSNYDDTSGNTGADYSWSFSIRDHRKPTVSLTSPSDGSTGNLLDADVSIQFSEDMNTSITPTLTQSTGTIVSYNFEGWASPSVAKWNHTSKWDWGDVVTLNVSGAYDDSDSQNLMTPYDWSFTVRQDTFKPHINATTPTVGQANVDADGDIIILFNETMDETHEPNLIIESGTNPGGWSVTWTSNWTTHDTVRFSHNTLSFSTTYQVTISNYKDEAGNVGNDYTWGFTTESEDIPPEITSTTPTDSATDVGKSTEVVVEFDESMDTGHTPTLTVVSGTDPTLTPTWTTSTKLTYSLTNDWESYDSIELEISDYRDSYGNVGSDYTWEFRIEDYIVPTVTSTTPPDGAINVTWDKIVIVNFSEDMDVTHDPSIIQLTGTVVNYDVSWFNSTALSITHDNWLNNENIKLRVSDYRDAHGTYGTQHTWNFTIEADTQPPQVSHTSPMDGEGNASLTNNIIIVFNEELNGSYIPTLKDTNNTNYTFVEWRSRLYGNDTAVFSHPEYNGTQNYTLTVDDYKDTSDNMGNPYSWSFTTEMTVGQRMVFRIQLATAIIIALFGAIVGVAIIVMIKRLLESEIDTDDFN